MLMALLRIQREEINMDYQRKKGEIKIIQNINRNVENV